VPMLGLLSRLKCRFILPVLCRLGWSTTVAVVPVPIAAVPILYILTTSDRRGLV